MQTPSIHPGGASKSQLIEALLGARDALRNARVALEATTPHSRDYLSPNDSFVTAMADHLARVDAVAKVDYEIYALAEAIDAKG